MRTNKRSTRELMGIAQILDYGLRTPAGDVAFFIIKPTNIGVLPAASITDRIQGLVKVIRTEGTVELMALNSWESFQQNKNYYRERMEKERLPKVREMLQQDCEHLDEMHLHRPYRISCQSALWRKKELLTLLRDRENAWEFEMFGSTRSAALGHRYLQVSKDYVRLNQFEIIPYVFTGIIKGKWFREVPALFKENGNKTACFPVPFPVIHMQAVGIHKYSLPALQMNLLICCAKHKLPICNIIDFNLRMPVPWHSSFNCPVRIRMSALTRKIRRRFPENLPPRFISLKIMLGNHNNITPA